MGLHIINLIDRSISRTLCQSKNHYEIKNDGKRERDIGNKKSIHDLPAHNL